MANGHLIVDFKTVAPILRKLLGTDVPGEVLANGPTYLVIAVENAADYDFELTPTANADIERLIGMELDEDDLLVGPLLIIEA